jgi:peptidoglycan/LPS O-acetylase OafA/YrhL
MVETVSADPNAAITRGRIYGLDILRAFSIFTVVYAHGYVLVREHVNADIYHALEFDGVGIFFVLSGYLIGKILLDLANRETFSMRGVLRFWIRRWFRTIPNYLLVLCLLLLIASQMQGGLPDGWPGYFIFVQNFAGPHPGFFPEAWSLSVEEWFYFLFPLVLFAAISVAGQHRQRAVLFCIIIFILIPTALRVFKATALGYQGVGVWDQDLRKIVILRLDSIVYGVLAAYLHRSYAAMWSRFPNIALVMGIALMTYDKLQWFYIENIFYRQYLTFTVNGVGAMLLIVSLSAIVTGHGVVYRAVTFISKISYAMYLVHLSLIQMILLPLIGGWLGLVGGGAAALANYVLFWALTIGLSYVLYRHFEQPVMNLRDRFSGPRPISKT